MGTLVASDIVLNHEVIETSSLKKELKNFLSEKTESQNSFNINIVDSIKSTDSEKYIDCKMKNILVTGHLKD